MFRGMLGRKRKDGRGIQAELNERPREVRLHDLTAEVRIHAQEAQ